MVQARASIGPSSILIAFLSLAPVMGDQSNQPTEGEKLFAIKVKPLFVAKCMACHGDDSNDIRGELDMRSRPALLAGGETFKKKVLVPGKGKASLLYQVTTRSVEDFKMPPKEADKLTQQEQWWIRDWINAGAPWPDDARIEWIRDQFDDGVQVPTSGGLSDEWTSRRYEAKHLWAYQPLRVVDVPDSEHPVDWFINRKLKTKGTDPAPPANARELARRLSFGLTGLPPEDTDDFARSYQENKKSAVREFANRLMATPHYGEHFGRQWLDVSRYADTAGFANDYARPNAWRYRDYVIRSFNRDKPYSQFVREQIAGDEISSNDPEKLIATGFLRMGPWEQTGMSVFRVTRQQWLDDVTDSVGQSFLGHSLMCAKCHDHKFDPVPTRDYYRVMAVFSTTQFAERDAAFLEVENRSGFAARQKWTQAKIQAYQTQWSKLKAKMDANRKAESTAAKVGDNGLDPGDEASRARMYKNMARHRLELGTSRPVALAVYTGKTIERRNVSGFISMPADPWDKGYLRNDTILTGGDTFTEGDAVTPGALSAAESIGDMPKSEFPVGRGKRRLALAGWITDPLNPLTARVMVNRVWSWHFGRGLAGNPNNVGATGSVPTHPELLDYLADWFMDQGWSIKKLNRLIVTSDAYQRASRYPDTKTSDPEWYATFQPRRLAAEELRDAMLFASGELNRKIGGIACRPDMNPEVANQPRQIMGGTASVYEPDPLPHQRNRRSVYAEKTRGLRDPFFETFNQPGPDKSCELRETSTVAPQALTMLNAEEMQDRALAFANRLIEEGGNDEQTVRRAFELALSRSASKHELQACLQHWRQAIREETGKSYSPRNYPTQVTRTVMAEKTGEPYDFIEHRPAYQAYVPDLQPHQVSASIRGLAQVCLVLFNLNEFAYLD